MKKLPLENEHLQAARYSYRSDLPLASPFCCRCKREGACPGMLFPLSTTCKEALNSWYSGLGILLKVTAIDHSAVAADSGFELCTMICCKASKQGIQFKGRSTRFCLSGCCWEHALVWSAPSPIPGGGMVPTGGCASCWHKASDSKESKALATYTVDSSSESWQLAQAEWNKMWLPFGGEPFALQELVGAPTKSEAIGADDVNPLLLLQELVDAHAPKDLPEQEAVRVRPSEKKRPQDSGSSTKQSKEAPEKPRERSPRRVRKRIAKSSCSFGKRGGQSPEA